MSENTKKIPITISQCPICVFSLTTFLKPGDIEFDIKSKNEKSSKSFETLKMLNV